MANENGVLFESEFNPQRFIQGIDQMSAALDKLKAQQASVQMELDKNTRALEANKAQLKQTKEAMDALDQSSETYQQDLAALVKRQQELTAQSKTLKDSISQNKAAFAENKKSVDEYAASIKGITTVVKQVEGELKGKSIFDVININQQVQEVAQSAARLRDIFKGKIDTAELDRLEQQLAGTEDEMQQLGQVLDFVKSKLDTLDPNSEEFADLNRIIQTGEEVLQAYGTATEQVDKKSVSLRAQLKALRDQLQVLEDQGKDNTAEFQQMQIEAGRLQDQIGDTQARIRVLASDTKNLDFGIGVIRGMAGAFGVAEGAAQLFGIKNEDVIQSIARLNAIMVILNGLQEIQNLLQKQSVVSIVGQEIALKAAAISQRVYAVAVGTSTGAMKAFRTALLTTGIGAFVVALGFAADAMGLFGGATDEADKSVQNFTLSIERLDEKLKESTDALNLSTDLAIEKAKQRGATDVQQSQIRIKQIQDEMVLVQQAFKELNDGLDAQLKTADGRTRKLSADAENELFDKYEEKRKQLQDRFTQLDNQATLEQEKINTKRIEDARRNAERQAQLYQAYLERLTQLQRQLRDKELEAQRQTEPVIRQQFANQLQDLSDDIDADVKSGKLSKQRARVLKTLVEKINKADLDKALKDFNEQVAKSQQEFDRQMFDLLMVSAEQRGELLRNESDREAAALRNTFERERLTLERELEDQLAAIQKTFEDGFISEETAKGNAQRVTAIYDELLELLAQRTSQKAEELSFNIFLRAQEDIRRVFSAIGLQVSEGVTQEVLALTARYTSGQIRYEEYQKELTRITKQESQQRIQQQITENQVLLQGIEERLKAEKDPQRQKELQDRIIQLRQQISDLQRQQAAAEAADTQELDDENRRRLGRIATYAQAIGQVVDQVVRFWQAANEAEQRALERSITLQERRVDAARRIAERGNAEYLRLEEDRLNELQVKQENAARRQLAINAVLQTSQALTAFVTALAQGIATGGPLGGLAIAAAVVGLIASGYAIIQSLQPTQRLKKGTKYVERNGAPAGDDTIPAMLDEGEAVIPRKRNQEYKETVAAVYDGAVPADVMNDFVRSFRGGQRALPKTDYSKLEHAANVVVAIDGRLFSVMKSSEQKLEENNQLLKSVNKNLKNMGVSLNIDRNGLALSLMDAVRETEISKKV